MKQWPGDEIQIMVTAPNLPLESFTTDTYDLESLINTMVGYLHRIIEYPHQGFQIPQDVPDKVIKAFEELVSLGYDKRLLKN
jgi:hypothetical protein